jgi:hypothetical protein
MTMSENKKIQLDNLVTALNEAAQLASSDILVLADGVLDPSLYSKNKSIQKLLRAFGLIIHHAKLGIKILKNRDKDLLLIYGFSTEFLFISYFTSLFNTKNVYLLVHHNIQQASQNSLLKTFIKIYHNLGYKFVVNETVSVLKSLDFDDRKIAKHFSLPLPVRELKFPYNKRLDVVFDSLITDNNTRNPKIGIIGSIRRGKRFLETSNLLLKLKKKINFSLIVGVNDPSDIGNINLDGSILIDTADREKYLAAIEYCDIIVLNYEKSQYFFRCSGVAADAIGAKTYVLCPNYPLMSHQIKYPSEVGVLYDDESELEMALEKALTLIFIDNNQAFENHYAERSSEKLAYLLDSIIANKCNSY